MLFHKFKKYAIFFLVWPMLPCQQAWGQPHDALLVWGKEAEGRHNIYYSKRELQKWSEPKQLSFSDKPEILPTVAANAKDEIWVIWAVLNERGGSLKYRYYRNGEWALPKYIQTSTTFDTAPSVIVDGSGDAWLVWSGTDQTDDDIFVARWINNEWSQPVKVNKDDQWPDILPRLNLEGSGRPRITWHGYDGSKYSTFFSIWTGMAWGPEQISHKPVGDLSNAQVEPVATDIADIISGLPDSVTDLNQASIYINRQGIPYTIRLQKK